MAMRTCADRIREACDARGVSVARLERECGFANGYIRGMRDGTMSAERLMKISQYLRVSFDWLLTGEEPKPQEPYYVDEETSEIIKDLNAMPDKKRLFKATRNLTTEQVKILVSMADSWQSDNDV